MNNTAVPKGHYAWLYLSNAAALLAGLAVYHLAGRNFGPEGFAEYALARRATNLLAPALMLGIGIALPRQLAMLPEPTAKRGSRLFFVAVAIVSAACLAFGLLVSAFPRLFSEAFLGDAGLAALAVPLVLYLVGLSWHSALWAYFRGTFRFRAASLLDICNLAVIPLLGFAVAGQSAVQLLTFVGIANAGVALAVSARWLRPSPTEFRADGASLLAYGLPRVPGDFALGAMLALPSLAVAQICSIEEAGHIAFGNTMLALAGTAVAPFSAILLPQSSRLIAAGRIADLRRSVHLTVRVFVFLALAGLAAVEIWMGVIVEKYLGAEFLPGVPHLRLLAYSVLPYVIYCSLRSVVDAGNKDAVNARNTYIAVAVMLFGIGVTWALGGGAQQIVAVAVIGHFLLGVLTLRAVSRLFGASRSGIGEQVRASGDGRPVHNMKVLSVIPGQPEGFSMIFARRQSAGVAASGVQVVDYHIAERVRPRGVLTEIRRLMRVVDEFDPDIVHSHYGTATAVICLLAARGRPVVVTFRGSDVNGSAAVSPLRSAIGRILSQVANLGASGVVCVSDGLRRKLWWRRGRALILPSGIDLDEFSFRGREVARRHLGFDEQVPMIVFNCGLDPWVKNLDLANAVVDRVRAELPNVEFVVMRGDWAPERVPWLLSAGDCLLVVSRQEGSPNIVREALACGLPIVSVDVGDVEQQIRNVHNCALCSAETDTLASAVLRVLRSHERSDGRKVAERYSVANTCSQLIALYEDLLGRKRSAEYVTGIRAGVAE